jgi:hypothetical protein
MKMRDLVIEILNILYIKEDANNTPLNEAEQKLQQALFTYLDTLPANNGATK